MHKKQIISAGKELKDASKVLIMLHGRGGSAEDILSFAKGLHVPDFALLAPQATNHTWYPYSFIAPPSENEPWLSSALALLKEITDELITGGIASTDIYFLGFSQGACLMLEFVTRNANEYGGIVAFTGGLIGDEINTTNYKGDFAGTRIFIGTSDPDRHVPVERVNASAELLEKMNANVMKKIYKNMGHMINREEEELANAFVFWKRG